MDRVGKYCPQMYQVTLNFHVSHPKYGLLYHLVKTTIHIHVSSWSIELFLEIKESRIVQTIIILTVQKLDFYFYFNIFIFCQV